MSNDTYKSVRSNGVWHIAACALVLATSACSPQSPLLKHEFTLAEKAGSGALSEGMNLETQGKFRKAAALYVEATKHAEDVEVKARALTELADLYGAGLGLPQKPQKQMELLKEAAALGYPAATFKLAEIYRGETGTHSPSDYTYKPNEALTLLQSIRDAYPYAAASLIEMRKNGQLAIGSDEALALEKETIEKFTAMAEAGDAEAMLALARLYRDGLLTHTDTTKMEAWYRKAIAAGNLTAAAELGRLWMQQGSGKTDAQALALLMQVAKHDELAVARSIAELHERQMNAKEAVIWYQKAAKDPQPHRAVYMKLAEAYTSGWGVEKNDATALQWYRKAADAGSTKATEAVMRAYFNGTGTAVDTEGAIQWMEKLFVVSPKRKYALAKDFAAGNGLPKSLPRAFMLAMRAAEEGDARGARYVAYAYERGEGVPVNEAKANQWFAKAGIVRKRGSKSAPSEHPLVTQGRQHESKAEYSQALALYKEAADTGDSGAMLRLASMYSTGIGVTQDIKKSFSWYLKAAEKGSAEGQYQVGLSYARGFGAEKDEAKALEWLDKAEKNGYPLAKETLKTLARAGR